MLTLTGLRSFAVCVRASIFVLSAFALAACGGSTEPRATPPSAPAIAGFVAGDAVLTVNFTPPEDDGGSPILTYEYTLDAGATWTTPTVPVTSSPLTIVGVSNGVVYSVRLRAVNRVGPGPASATQAMTPFRAPDAPTISISHPGYRSARIIITPEFDGGSEVLNYEYSLDGTTWIPRAPASRDTEIVIDGLSDNTTYLPRVRAVNAAGASPASATGSFLTAPAIPLTITASADSLGVNFCTDDIAGATSYRMWILTSRESTELAAYLPSATACGRSGGSMAGWLLFLRPAACNSQNTCSPPSLAVDSVLTRPHKPFVTAVNDIGPGHVRITVYAGYEVHPAVETTNYATSVDGGPWVVRAPASTNPAFDFSGLLTGSTVNIRIVAINAAGNSEPSNAVQVVVP